MKNELELNEQIKLLKYEYAKNKNEINNKYKIINEYDDITYKN